jgi:hypothetical protein
MVIVLALVLFQPTAPQGLPPELKAAFDSRQFLNAQITWESHTRAADQEFACWGIATYVGSQIAYETHYPDGPPGSSVVDHAIIRGLYWEGRLFENAGDPLSARLFDDPRMGSGIIMDYRVLGMHARPKTGPAHNPFEPAADAAPDYTVSRHGGLVFVSARERNNGGSLERRWSIDPQRGWNVVLYEESERGRPTVSVVSTLAKTGDVWFPQQVEYRHPDGAPFLTVRMRSVKINDPSLPQRLAPEFIEVVPGTNIYRMFRDAPPEPARFDGQRLVSVEEFKRRRRAGEIQRGDAFVRGLERLTEAGDRERAAKRYTPSAWERYVAEFIAEHGLDAAQSNRAWSIYRDCRDSAARYVQSHKAEFDDLERAQGALKFAPDANQSANLAGKAADLRRPIERIFEEQLVARLDRLPTRAQWALGRATSEPVSGQASSP